MKPNNFSTFFNFTFFRNFAKSLSLTRYY